MGGAGHFHLPLGPGGAVTILLPALLLLLRLRYHSGGGGGGGCGSGGGSPLPPGKHAQQPFELSPEAVVEPAVDEGVVAGAAHGQPVEGEVEDVVGRDGVAGEQQHVAVEREPAHGEHHHHRHQHLDGALALAPLQEILLACHVTDGIGMPQAPCHTQVGPTDDEEGQDVEQDKGGQVQILPEDVRRFRKIRHTEAADDVFAENGNLREEKEGRRKKGDHNVWEKERTRSMSSV